MEGLFGLQTPDHLLHKLEREHERWKADPLNVDLAWNFFVTAEHLPDWLAHRGPRTLEGFSITKFKRAQPLTRICANLANGAKHFIPRVKPEERLNTSVERTAREMSGYVEEGYVEEGYVGEEPVLRVYLTPDEWAALRQEDSRVTAAEIDALRLAALVLTFWQQYFQEHATS
jgi:hypothetical protein